MIKTNKKPVGRAKGAKKIGQKSAPRWRKQIRRSFPQYRFGKKGGCNWGLGSSGIGDQRKRLVIDLKKRNRKWEKGDN